MQGLSFFQTQAVYDIEHMREFRKLTKHMDCKVLAGIVPLKSPGMAKFMTANVPGIFVPDEQIERLRAAGKRKLGIRRYKDGRRIHKTIKRRRFM